jgi:hypothetical protein
VRRPLQFVLIAAAICVAFTPLPRARVERWYSRGVYPAIQPRLTSVSNRVPFAVFDVVLIGGVAAVLAMWFVRLRRTQGSTVRTVTDLLIDTACVGSALYFWFLVAWGLNYQREPLRLQLDFQDGRITAEALRDFAFRDVEAMNQLYDS